LVGPFVVGLAQSNPSAAAETESVAGVAKVDITPDYPIRLSGYGGRRKEHEGVVHPVWAKAVAFGSDTQGPTVLITVDNLGVPDYLVTDVADRLQKKVNLPRERLAVCSSHAHTAPCLTNVAPTLFGEPIPAGHQAHIDRYTRELADKLEGVALAALKDRGPAKLAWGQGKVDFAHNRRTPGGPVDHDMPLLRVTDLDGTLRAILVNYACHCTALDDNQISGDWAGYAQQQIERSHPGVIALVAIGCGADANPEPRVGHNFAEQHGTAIAREVDRLLASDLKPLDSKVTTKLKRVDLPFDTLPTREEWQRRAATEGAVGYHARVQLARLDAGESLPTELDYPIQTWAFGDALAMVFLPGEVVVDYSLRLKKELNSQRVWINAYSNDVPCYIPSKRILKEGGYEGGDAMIYYNRPTRFTPAVEDLIVDTVGMLLPRSFWSADKQAESPLSLSPAESLARIKLKPGFRAELVAAEPEVVDPVAIDFGPDGRLWVVEMNDYPMGIDGNWQPGGRLKFLEDVDGDGRFEKATLLADDLPFPTGVMAWRDGALVCAAPDILYIADTDHDGRADVRQVVFTGFPTDNYQARVNGLSYGLDNWIHGANGLLGGHISTPGRKGTVELGARDFRFRPNLQDFEPTSGLTQQGRVHDDWGNWFGSTNGELLKHYPVPDHYLRRNPHVAGPPTQVYVPRGDSPNHLHPVSRTLVRFNDPEQVDHATSACGATIYRDELLGADIAGDAFTCEPVHNLVTRRKLTPEGVTFAGNRVNDEQFSEFLASTDNWFRPVQALTGPDGALWIVDMYRLVIEHPRWITPERLRTLDVRGGANQGRIYRIARVDAPARKVPRLLGADTAALVAAIDSPNGPQRDLAQRLLVERQDPAAAAALARLAKSNPRATTRAQAMCALAGLGKVGAETLASDVLPAALSDSHPGVREQAIRLCDPLLAASPKLGEVLARLADDSEPRVRYQLAFTLGMWADPRAASALGKLALAAEDDPYQTAAVLSSITPKTLPTVLQTVLSLQGSQPDGSGMLSRLLALAAGFDDLPTLQAALAMIDTPRSDGSYSLGQLTTFGAAFDALERRGVSAEKAFGNASKVPSGKGGFSKVHSFARIAAKDSAADETLRLAAIGLLGRNEVRRGDDLETLSPLLSPQTPAAIQSAAIDAVTRSKADPAADVLLAGWASYGPTIRGRVLDVLATRTAWSKTLLDRVETGTIAAAEVDAAHRIGLTTHRNPDIKQRSEKVFAAVADSNRKEVLASHQNILSLTPDGVHGAVVFRQKCAACHRMGEEGHALGPNLAALTDKSPAALLVAILDPNRTIEAKFVAYVAQTSQGLTYTGVLAEETATSITLAGQENARQVVLRSDLEQFQSAGRSFMPEGLEKDLSRQDLADVIAFLADTSEKPKTFPGNKPDLVKPTDAGVLRLLASNGEIYGDSIRYEQELSNVGYWHHEMEHVVWTVEVPETLEYTAHLEYSCEDNTAGNPFVFQLISQGENGGGIRGRVDGTGGWATFRNVEIGTIRLPSGRHRVVMRPAGPFTGVLFDLREVRLTPVVDPQAAKDKAEPAQLARLILDEAQDQKLRNQLVQKHADRAAKILSEMTRDDSATPWDHAEEYRRIPWLWKLSLAAGRRNKVAEMREVLAIALPAQGKPLRDWQAVIVGGGVINGITQVGGWPRECILEVIKDDKDLTTRWEQTLELSVRMADDEKVSPGTRYDALRILGADTWERRNQTVVQYLKKGVDESLQMGAVAALSDMQHAEASNALLRRLHELSDDNKQLALDALLRDDGRAILLLEYVAAGRLPASQLGAARVRKLVEHPTDSVRSQAISIFK